MSTGVGNPDEYAGYRTAVSTLEMAGGVLMTGEAARALALLVLHTTGPAVRAEVLADLADDALDLGLQLRSAALVDFGHALDLASHHLRTASEVDP
jgi:hypothetical protein